ncbi:DEKNAAC103675 [Brettanomyces naardenensis]|uniref:DEKNAAC103675 n=1 Tax=Brettanomyces naardenensis TaxID=13370 RepID=A0A448YNJ7_BRENA|nr:DEKNAAC103675 [Brettanomyces naardenensis]
MSLDSEPPPYDPRAKTQMVFLFQLFICAGLGSFIFVLFCILRRHFPVMYTIRPFRNRKIKMLPDSLFGWLSILYKISTEEVLQVAGLDAYVFLRFFRMCVKILIVMAILGFFIMSPVRYLLTGHFDRDESVMKRPTPSEPSDPPSYLLVCTAFTYIFTGIVYYFMFWETKHIIRVRQRFLGSQKSLTDRTIMITNVPKGMRDEKTLKSHIEALDVGAVDTVILARDYRPLAKLFESRKEIISKLELLYSQFYGIDVRLWYRHRTPSATLHVHREMRPPGRDDIVYSPDIDADTMSSGGYTSFLSALDRHGNPKKRPTHRIGGHFGGLFGKKVDSFDYYSRKLISLDGKIRHTKASVSFRPIPFAFVSMKSITAAQMAAQALFSPNPMQLETCLAPAPFDISWKSLLFSARSVFVRRNVIELICIGFSALLIIPIRYITSLMNVESIKKLWPSLAEYLLTHEAAKTLVTGILPTYLFSIINTILPYFISFLCQLQGLPSKGEVELSVVRKNFMYIFFNLFLVFTLLGTISSYKALLSDTTKIAPLLAKSMKSLSLFYIDLIVLQGMTMLPLQLLQIGDLSLSFWRCVLARSQQTPTKYRNQFYKPSIFQVGLILPQHLMIFIIILIYSVLSTKIMVCGLVYFFIGYWVYKYQLVYSMVHPYHSTGKVWPIVVKRICLGLFFLHLQMFGSIALEESYYPAALIIPLFPTSIIAFMYFKRNYRPLLYYIALDAIKTEGQSVEAGQEDDLESLIATSQVRKRGDSVVLNDAYEEEDDDDDLTEDGEDISREDTEVFPGEDEIANISQSTVRPRTSMRRLRRKQSTIEEEREATQSYTYPYLLDRLDGPWVGFVGDYVDTIRYRMVSRTVRERYGSVDDVEEHPEDNKEVRTEIIRKEDPRNELD